MKESTALQSYRCDPEAFQRRIQERAQELFPQGYSAGPGPALGQFYVIAPDANPDGGEYLVDLFARTCDCPLMAKAELPADVRCKHVHGAPLLIEEKLSSLRAMVSQHVTAGRTERAEERLTQLTRLETAWTAYLDERLSRQAEEEADGRALNAETVAERGILDAGYQP